MRLFVCVVLLASILPARAIAQNKSVNFGPAQTFLDGGTISVTLTVSPAITGNARLHLTNIFGDLNDPAEIVTVSVDGTVVATFGAFGGPIQCGNRPSQIITIPQNVLAAAAADGRLVLRFDADPQMDFCDPAQPNLRLSGTLSYLDARAQIVQRTRGVIRNFMGGRANQLTALEPDLSAGLTGSIGSGGLSAQGSGGNFQATFGSSVQEVANSKKKKKSKAGSEEMMRLGRNSSSASYASKPSKFDIWVRGTVAQVDDETRNSNLGVLLVGADYRINSNLLVGLLTQGDWVEETDDVFLSEVEGRGFTIGPYLVARLNKYLIFDSRAAWGVSDNEINPMGDYVDNFDTERWLVRGRLTGDFQQGAWRFSPHVGIIYFEEEQEAYVDSLGSPIPSQSITLGRVTFGPKVIYTEKLADGTIISPQFSVEGIWDFDEIESVDVISGLTTGSDTIRARTEARLAATFVNGWSLVGEGFYDGIGSDDLEAFGGSITVRAPIN